MGHGRLAVLAFVLGCGSSTHPVVQRSLTTYSDEPIRRSEEIEGTRARPSAESRKTLTKGEQRVETGAATAAAIVGSLLSDSQNTVIGVGVALDPVPELGARPIPVPDPPRQKVTPAPAPAQPKIDPQTLVPWVEIKPPAE